MHSNIVFERKVEAQSTTRSPRAMPGATVRDPLAVRAILAPLARARALEPPGPAPPAPAALTFALSELPIALPTAGSPLGGPGRPEPALYFPMRSRVCSATAKSASRRRRQLRGGAALLARERVDLPNDRLVVLQQRPLDEYSKCIYTLPVITWDEAKRRANLRKHGIEIVESIVHTEDGDHIHVISMRKATKREREIYFESIAN